MKTTDYHALADFRYQIRLFLNRSEQAARGAGLKPQHHQLLLALKGALPGWETTVSYLAERLQLKHHSLVELIDRLEARGLVRRTRSRSDRRVVLVDITPRGERVLRQLSVHHRHLLQKFGPSLVQALKRAVAPSSDRGRHRAERMTRGSRPRSARRAKAA